MKPLQNIRVLDLTRVLSGPFCTMNLADLGADIVKLEGPTGDDSRGNPPHIKGESTYFMSLNRGKHSISMNLKEPAAKDAFLRMVKDVDVVIENFRPGTMEKLGLGYEVLKEINPKIIYCAISGFGQTGPYKTRAAYDIIIQAMAGIMSITGPENGSPVRVGASVGDIIAGLYATISILAAIEHRNQTGEGQSIDIGMLDCLVAILENAVVRYYATGQNPIPVGCRHPTSSPFDAYKSSDGLVILAIQNNKLWENLCKEMGCEHLINDERFATNALRVKHEAELKPLLEEITKTKTTQEWIDALLAVDVPCGPLNKIETIVADPHLLHRNMITEVQHPIVGSFKTAGIPIKYSKTKCEVSEPAPVLGQHTDEILKKFKFSDDEIDALYKAGAVMGMKEQ